MLKTKLTVDGNDLEFEVNTGTKLSTIPACLYLKFYTPP